VERGSLDQDSIPIDHRFQMTIGRSRKDRTPGTDAPTISIETVTIGKHYYNIQFKFRPEYYNSVYR